ncbi:MAG: patatin-like phospholipase family protein [Bacteroidota bacterium]
MKKNNIFIIILFSLVLSSLLSSQVNQLTIAPHYSPSDKKVLNVNFQEIRRPKVALVLSGGGARGIAQIGVIEVLERNNIPIDYIVGSSMGSIIGGLYASGYSTAQLRKLVDTTDWNYVLSFTQDTDREQLFLSQKQTADKKQLTIRFDGLEPVIPSAFASGQRLTNFINQLTLQALYHPIDSFDDLKIPFRSIATDLISGKKIVFSKGNLSEALRASISVPLLYTTIKKDTMELTDGGLVSNIPVEAAKELGADIIIVVNTISPLRTAGQMNTPWEIADQIINIMAQQSNKRSLDSATIVITPDLGQYSTSDFAHLDFAIEQGRVAAEAAMTALKDSIESTEQRLLQDSSPLSSFTFAVRSIRNSISPVDSAKLFSISRELSVGDTTTISHLRTLLGQIYRLGWYQNVNADLTLSPDGADIEFRASPNADLVSITVSGNSMVSKDEFLSGYASLLNKPVNIPELIEAMEGSLSMYRDNGYSLARIQTMTFDSLTGALHISVNEGIIYKIYLKGKEKSRDWVVWRELGFRDGSLFTVSTGIQALRNLYGTNLFDQVLMDVAYEDGLPTIVIQMDEKPTDVSRFGLRADNERNLQPTLEFRNENVLGTATEFGASFAGGLRNRKFLLDFQANRFINTYLTMNFDVYYDLRDIFTYTDDVLQTTSKRFVRSRSGEYRQVKYGASFKLGQQVAKLGTVNIEYRLESDEIKFISGSGYTPEKFTVQSLQLSSVIDSRDRYPFPRSGSITNFSWETATSSLKGVVGDVGYSKIFFEYGTNISYQRFTLHPKITIGFGDQTVPLSQQFALGGEDSFFGLREYDSRGRQIFVLNTELRTLFPFKVLWDTYFRIRYDLGSIWPQQEDIRLRDFHHGIGVGLSLDTPIGPANFSIGRSFYIRRDLLDQPVTLGPVIAYFSLGYPIF